jgi:hypothetical protein
MAVPFGDESKRAQRPGPRHGEKAQQLAPHRALVQAQALRDRPEIQLVEVAMHHDRPHLVVSAGEQPHDQILRDERLLETFELLRQKVFGLLALDPHRLGQRVEETTIGQREQPSQRTRLAPKCR